MYINLALAHVFRHLYVGTNVCRHKIYADLDYLCDPWYSFEIDHQCQHWTHARHMIWTSMLKMDHYLNHISDQRQSWNTNLCPVTYPNSDKSRYTVQLYGTINQKSQNCPDNPDILWTIQKLSRQSRNSHWTIQKLYGQSRICPDNPETVRTIQKLS